MNNLGKMLAALLVATMSLTVAPMATATTPANCTSVVSGFTDKNDAVIATPSAPLSMNQGTLGTSGADSKYFLRITGLDGQVVIAIEPVPSAVTFSFKVIKDVSGCPEEFLVVSSLMPVVIINDADANDFYVLIERTAPSILGDLPYVLRVLDTGL